MGEALIQAERTNFESSNVAIRNTYFTEVIELFVSDDPSLY
jgi:hypothetical protein